jgi:hypothetical protein
MELPALRTESLTKRPGAVEALGDLDLDQMVTDRDLSTRFRAARTLDTSATQEVGGRASPRVGGPPRHHQICGFVVSTVRTFPPFGQ